MNETAEAQGGKVAFFMFADYKLQPLFARSSTHWILVSAYCMQGAILPAGNTAVAKTD